MFPFNRMATIFASHPHTRGLRLPGAFACRGGGLARCHAQEYTTAIRRPSLQPVSSAGRALRFSRLRTKGGLLEDQPTLSSPRGKAVVITGGTKGVGYAMAREFLLAGDRVMICGRNAERLQTATSALWQEFGTDRLHGVQCDVSDPESMARLGEHAQARLGRVDYWINNAGDVTSKRLLADVDPSDIVRVVGTNVVGSLLGCREAIRIMRHQPGSRQPRYHIFNLGFSPFGAQFSRSAVTHKATKMALKQLNESLTEELLAEGVSSIAVHNLSPGMVLTDLLLKDSNPVARRVFNALAEEPETVAAALVPRIRAVEGTGGSLDYMPPADALLRILRGLPQVLNGGRFFDKEGNRVAAQGESYKPNGVREQY